MKELLSKIGTKAGSLSGSASTIASTVSIAALATVAGLVAINKTVEETQAEQDRLQQLDTESERLVDSQKMMDKIEEITQIPSSQPIASIAEAALPEQEQPLQSPTRVIPEVVDFSVLQLSSDVINSVNKDYDIDDLLNEDFSKKPEPPKGVVKVVEIKEENIKTPSNNKKETTIESIYSDGEKIDERITKEETKPIENSDSSKEENSPITEGPKEELSIETPNENTNNEEVPIEENNDKQETPSETIIPEIREEIIPSEKEPNSTVEEKVISEEIIVKEKESEAIIENPIITETPKEELPIETPNENTNNEEVPIEENNNTTTENNNQEQPPALLEKAHGEGVVLEKEEVKIVTVEKTITKTIPFNTRVIYDNTILEGVKELVSEGIDGTITQVLQEVYINDVLTNTNVISEHESPSTEEVIRVGTKKEEEKKPETSPTIEHDVEIDVEEDSITKKSETGESTTIVKPEAVITTDFEVELNEIPFKTKYIYDETMYEGQQVVETVGQYGAEKIMYEIVYVDGVQKARNFISREVDDVVDQVVRVGTLKQEDKQLEEGIPGAEVSVTREVKDETKVVEVEYIQDSNFIEGYEKVEDEGLPTIVRVVTDVKTLNGEVTERVEVSKEIIQYGRPKTIRVGTKSPNQEILEIETQEFPIEYVDDNTLKVGIEEVTQEGKNGTKQVFYNVIYNTDGSIKEKAKTSERILTPATPKIIKRGTKKEPVIKDMAKVRDTSANMSLEKDDKLVSGRIIEKVTINYNHTAEEISKLTEQERYTIGQQKQTNTMISRKEGESSRILSGIPLSQGMVDYINKNLDIDLLNQYMLVHVNNLRKEHGSPLLTYNKALNKGSQTRALEQAEIGNLRSDGKPHTRPDGTKYNTAFMYLGEKETKKLGENIAQIGSTNTYEMLSEKLLAEKLFAQWKDSSGHFKNMIHAPYKTMSFSVQVGRENYISPDYSDLYGSIIGVQIFSL